MFSPVMKPPKRQQYSNADILKAIAEIQNKTLSIRKSAKKYNVPATTLRSKLSGRYNLEKCRPGKFIKKN